MMTNSDIDQALLENTNPPQKRARHWNEELEVLRDEETWYRRMSIIKERNLMRAVYDNAMNSLIEGSGCLGQVAVEDEAVSMAIRCHGLTCTNTVLKDNPSGWSGENPSTSTSSMGSCSTSREDILSQAVTAAIRKKGLGAVDR